MPRGVPLIYNEEMLAAAEEVVVDFLTQELEPSCDGVIIAAFGDPGVARLYVQQIIRKNDLSVCLFVCPPVPSLCIYVILTFSCTINQSISCENIRICQESFPVPTTGNRHSRSSNRRGR